MNRLTWSCFAFCFASVLATSSAFAYTGRVIYSDTGKPAAGVWAVAIWQFHGGFGPHPTSGCMLAAARTNEVGEFVVRLETGLLDGLLGSSARRPRILLYARDHVEARQFSEDGKPYALVRDPNLDSPLGRLDRIRTIVHKADCGVDENIRARQQLIPLFDDLAEETTEIVRDNPQWDSDQRKMRFLQRVIRLDTPKAVEEEWGKGWR